jgi:hypothetical protein
MILSVTAVFSVVQMLKILLMLPPQVFGRIYPALRGRPLTPDTCKVFTGQQTSLEFSAAGGRFRHEAAETTCR